MTFSFGFLGTSKPCLAMDEAPHLRVALKHCIVSGLGFLSFLLSCFQPQINQSKENSLRFPLPDLSLSPPPCAPVV